MCLERPLKKLCVCVCVCAVEGKGPLRPEDASRDRASNLPLGALSQTEDISIPK